MPKQWKTRNDDYIVYTYDKNDDVFVGQNKVVVGLGYVLDRMDPYYKN